MILLFLYPSICSCDMFVWYVRMIHSVRFFDAAFWYFRYSDSVFDRCVRVRPMLRSILRAIIRCRVSMLRSDAADATSVFDRCVRVRPMLRLIPRVEIACLCFASDAACYYSTYLSKEDDRIDVCSRYWNPFLQYNQSINPYTPLLIHQNAMFGGATRVRAAIRLVYTYRLFVCLNSLKQQARKDMPFESDKIQPTIDACTNKQEKNK